MKKKVYGLAIICIMTLSITAGCLMGCSFPEQAKENVPDKYVADWTESDSFSLDDSTCVVRYEKEDDKPIKVLQVTDVHYDDHNKEEWRRNKVKQMIRDSVAQTQPDIIALTGDWSSNSFYLYDYEEVPEGVECEKGVKQDQSIPGLREQRSREIFDLIEELCVEYGCKWAPIFGNHDAEGDLDKYDFAEIFAGYDNCLFRAGYSNIKGVGNYVVAVTHQGKLVQSLFFLDSHSAIDGGSKYDYIGKSQINWYKWCVNGLNRIYAEDGGQGAIPSMMYIHIPLTEYKTAYKKAYSTSNHIIGLNREGVFHSYRNSGMFKMITELASTKAVFAGHDHDNSSSVMYKDVMLCYGVQSGWCDEYAQYGVKGALLAVFGVDGKVSVSHYYTDLLNNVVE